MKLSRLFSKSFSRPHAERKSTQKMPQKNPDRAQANKVNHTSSKTLYSGSAEEGLEVIDWELRPGGMLVQRRDAPLVVTPSSGPLIKVKVSHGLYQHDITIPAHATFGDMKWLLAQEVGLQPQEQRLIFQGKEKDDNEFLHIAGVKDMSKVILVEDPASKEKKLEEMKRDNNVGKACQAVSQVRAQVDKLARQISALDGALSSGSKVQDNDFSVLAELLMRQLLELDSIHVEGEAKVQRRIEVKRVQSFAEHLDSLKGRHGNPICSNAGNPICSNAVVITNQWGTFNSGLESLAAPPLAPATMTTNWELF